jgi:hypothetical protein
MKRSALALLLVPAMASADWSAPGFPAFQDHPGDIRLARLVNGLAEID